MLLHAEILQLLTAKVKEQSEALTQYARQELGLPTSCEVRLTVAIKKVRIRVYKVKPDTHGWVYDQEPTRKDWVVVIGIVEKLLARAKYGQQSRITWSHILSGLRKVQKAGNAGYVWRATQLNVHFERNSLPYRLVRVEKPGEDILYALRVTKGIPF